MVSTVGSAQVISGSNAVTSIAKIAALNKQASALRQQLLRANDKQGTSEADANQTESIMREIVDVQTQIEQLVLETQLSRLNVANATKSGNGQSGESGASGHSGPGTHDAGGVDGKSQGAQKVTAHAAPNDAHVAKSSDPYKAVEDTGQLVDIKA